MKSAWLGLAILLVLPHTAAARPQQDDSSSVADAARRAREQRKEQPKSAKVWDNDTIPKKPGEVSVIGQKPEGSSTDDATANANANAAAGDAGAAPAENSADVAGAPPTPAPAPAAPAADEKSDRDKLAAEIAGIQSDLTAARARLQTLKADLDILQRKYTLDSQMYYSKPNYSADKDGAANIAAEKSDLEAKQQEVADAQMKVDQLEAKLAAIH